MRYNTLAWALCALLVAAPLLAADSLLRDGHPTRYTVQPGDTLWDISGRFLTHPWYWPEIWYENPDIDNPHLIYPGDVLVLTIVDGEPRLTVQRAGSVEAGGGGPIELTPQVRVEDLDEAIATIPMSALRPFISGDRLVTAEAFATAPYIVAGPEERVLAAEGDPVYVRGLPPDPIENWDILSKGEAFVDPETGELLGYHANNVGTAQLLQSGDPATFRITDSNREVRPGNRLMQAPEITLRSHFYPSAPAQPVEGLIIAVLGGVTQIGQYDVVAINRGTRHGLEPGSVLLVYQRGRTVEDPYSEERESVTLPDVFAGEMLVFRTFERMSFGLIMEANRAMEVEDVVRSP